MGVFLSRGRIWFFEVFWSFWSFSIRGWIWGFEVFWSFLKFSEVSELGYPAHTEVSRSAGGSSTGITRVSCVCPVFVSPTKPSAWAEQVRGTGEDLSNLPAARGKGRYAADCGVCCYRTARVTSHESLAEASDGDGADLHTCVILITIFSVAINFYQKNKRTRDRGSYNFISCN